MSRPRYYWYGFIKKQIGHIDKLRKSSNPKAIEFVKVFDEVSKETAQMTNGSLRIKAINDVLIKKTHTIDGVAMKVNYHRNIVQSWISEFVNTIGKRLGY